MRRSLARICSRVVPDRGGFPASCSDCEAQPKDEPVGRRDASSSAAVGGKDASCSVAVGRRDASAGATGDLWPGPSGCDGTFCITQPPAPRPERPALTQDSGRATKKPACGRRAAVRCSDARAREGLRGLGGVGKCGNSVIYGWTLYPMEERIQTRDTNLRTSRSGAIK